MNSREAPETAATMHVETPAAPQGKQLSSSFILAAAYRRLERAITRDDIALPAPRPPARVSRPSGEQPVVTLPAPRRTSRIEQAVAAAVPSALKQAPRADPGALAGKLASDLEAKLDEIVYLWSVVREAEPFGKEGEKPLGRRAAELALVSAGGAIDLPIEPLLRAVRGFLDEHGLDEEYVRRLCAWYGV